VNYTGVIIEESLEDKKILSNVPIVETKVEQVTDEHQTPWVNQWTMHTVEIPEEQAEKVAAELSVALDSQHAWYGDFKNDSTHIIIFRGKYFKIDRSKPGEYTQAVEFGMSLGIPDYQLDFSPQIEEWKRENKGKL
jgi:hypothetical protein